MLVERVLRFLCLFRENIPVGASPLTAAVGLIVGGCSRLEGEDRRKDWEGGMIVERSSE